MSCCFFVHFIIFFLEARTVKFYLVGIGYFLSSIKISNFVLGCGQLPRNSTMLGLRFVIWEQSSNSSRDSFSSLMRQVFWRHSNAIRNRNYAWLYVYSKYHPFRSFQVVLSWPEQSHSAITMLLSTQNEHSRGTSLQISTIPSLWAFLLVLCL